METSALINSRIIRNAYYREGDLLLNKLLNKIKEVSKMKTEMVKVIYRGMECEITKDQWEDLRDGWITWSDLFD